MLNVSLLWQLVNGLRKQQSLDYWYEEQSSVDHYAVGRLFKPMCDHSQTSLHTLLKEFCEDLQSDNLTWFIVNHPEP